MNRTGPLLVCLGWLQCFYLIMPMGWTESPAPSTTSTPKGKIDYNRDIRPVLSNHCFACHGPDEGQRKAGLRLDQRNAALTALKSGAIALVPNHPEKSELWQRISSDDEAHLMPPPEFGKPLSEAQIDLLKRWIEQGAAWEDHWSYKPVQRPPLPSIKHMNWPKNGIDYFVLAHLEQHGWQPSPEADRTTLIRRLTFDLTGLPPTPEEIKAFVQDTDANAYEKLVDRLLASPRFGERWAVHWLDLARFADTNGYHIDNHRDMWKWRDWVIDAFNRNMPFDQFTIEQLAGDLLDQPTLEQRIATGFHRNVMVNFEGGADPDEYLTKYIVDRVNTTATVWLGSTMTCAECHDHKYDPFTQKDFYRLYAIFHNVPEKGLDGQQSNPVPSMKVPSSEDVKKKEELTREIQTLQSRMNQEMQSIAWPAESESSPTMAFKEYVWVDDDVPAGGQANSAGGMTGWQWQTVHDMEVLSGRRSMIRTAQGLSQHFFENAADYLRIGVNDHLFAYVFIDPANPPKQIMLQWNNGAWEHRAYWGESHIPWGVDGTPSRFHAGPLPPAGRWVRVQVPAKAVGLTPGALVRGMAFTQFGGTVAWDRAGIQSQLPQAQDSFDSFAAWQRWETMNRQSQLPPSVRDAMKKKQDQRSDQEQLALKEFFIQRVHPATRDRFKPMTEAQDAMQKSLTDLENKIPTTMVMEELPQPRMTHVLKRGDFRAKGEPVTGDVPQFLLAWPVEKAANRLDLARWLVDPKHPLTARVTLNRYWEQFFGHGIVKSTEEFGAQGDWPSHPELLDWLAAEWLNPTPAPIGSGAERPWNIKAMMRYLATSATYRQQTKVTPAMLRADPENRFFMRGPRLRLQAEMIRDAALAISGLLDPRIGGPSIKPYQPPGLWEQVAFGGGFSSQTYEQSRGQDLYRRGLYVYWKRSLPHPSLSAFDAPNRELCCDRRPVTNTPLQALTLLNDPIFVEAARVFAARIINEGGQSVTERVQYAFEWCTSRPPNPEELKWLVAFYHRQYEKWTAEPEAAKKLIQVGEAPLPKDIAATDLAAWTAMANLLFNLDETITKN